MNNPVSILPNDLREFVVQEESGWVEIRFPHAVSTPVVSVVVQTYQHGRFIEQTLQSILDQETSFQFEILVGEDGSDDGTHATSLVIKCLTFYTSYLCCCKLLGLRGLLDLVSKLSARPQSVSCAND